MLQGLIVVVVNQFGSFPRFVPRLLRLLNNSLHLKQLHNSLHAEPPLKDDTRSRFNHTAFMSACICRSSSTWAIFSCIRRSISCLYSSRHFSSCSVCSTSCNILCFIFSSWSVFDLATYTKHLRIYEERITPRIRSFAVFKLRRRYFVICKDFSINFDP